MNDVQYKTPIDTKLSSTTKMDLLMSTIILFFQQEHNLNKLVEILNGKSKISLRILDWFVTNYAKKIDVVYYIQKLSGTKFVTTDFVVYNSYKAQLKAYQKKQFDPFCRNNRIEFEYNNDKVLNTTVGQLNFFKWAIENKIIDYVDKYFDKITEDMNNYSKLKSEYKQQVKKAKTVEEKIKLKSNLAIKAKRKIKRHHVKITLGFS